MLPALPGGWPHWLERFTITLWVGGMWTTGFIVTPVLFKTLDDRMLAGNIAGQLFTVISYIGICAALILVVLAIHYQGKQVWRTWPFRILLIMLLVVLIGEFGITPMMQEIKTSVGTALQKGTEAHSRFAVLHGISSSLFLLNSVLGLMLVVRGGLAARD